MERKVRNNFSQTEIPLRTEKGSQVPRAKHFQVQTDPCESKRSDFAEFDLDTLTTFLNRVTPLVCTILEKNIKSKAFSRQHLLSEADSTSISRIYQLEKSLSEEFFCSSLSWNSVGSAIVAAYSNVNHRNWCEHDSSVNVWSINRKEFDPKKANLTIETDCCISCISFHPELPAIIAAGKLNGEILLWDISVEDDSLLGSSAASGCNHREPVTGIHWIQTNRKSGQINLASCSLDGKILLWRYEDGLLTAVNGFTVLLKDLQNFAVKSHKENDEVGITSMSINSEDNSIFIIGLEGGGIFQCSFDSIIPASYSTLSSIPLKNPIIMGFEQHKGQVTSLNFSPHTRNIFLSAGSEGEIRLYSLLQPKPIKIFQLATGGINAAQWSPVRPLVFTCVSSDGYLHVWDLLVNEKVPVETCQLTVEKASGLSLQQNIVNPSLLATSCTDGNVQVWEISGAALNSNAQEKFQLQILSRNID